jgi:tetratricopeptide (TPR) repeat protein
MIVLPTRWTILAGPLLVALPLSLESIPRAFSGFFAPDERARTEAYVRATIGGRPRPVYDAAVRRPLTRAAAVTACALTLLLVAGSTATAQTPLSIAEAERFRNERRFADAVQLLESILGADPANPTALRLLAQTLYWLHENSRARQLYERGLEQHPDDLRLRLDYGRMLLETGERRRARALLTPLLQRADAAGEASALLGLLAYWEGDLTSARRLMRDAVQAGVTEFELERHLRDLRLLGSPWISIAPTVFHDDQPLSRAGGRAEGGWFLTPLVPIRVRGGWQRHRATDDDVGVAVQAVDMQIRAYLPRTRLDLEGAGGIVQRGASLGSQWTGRMSAGLRIGSGLSVGIRTARDAYLQTVASLRTDVSATLTEGYLSLDHPRGWSGSAEFGRHRFYDGNNVRHAYGWLLAPIVQRDAFGVQIGYSGGSGDSDDLRFVLPPDDAAQLLATGSGEDLGRYDPYHTPMNQQTHAWLSAVRVSSARATVRMSSSVAIHAEEDRPFFFLTTAGLPERGVSRLEFTPWSVRMATELRINDRFTTAIEAEAGSGSFYEWTAARVQLIYRFLPHDRVSGDRR